MIYKADIMRGLLSIFVVIGLAACSSSDGDSGPPQTGTDACDVAGQKQFVLDNMYAWYLWNDLLPESVNIDDYASAEDFLAYLSSFQPLDHFSFINSAEADAQFFGEGKYEGFGFSSRFLAADDLRLTRVFTISPAFDAGLLRGHRILSLDGRSIAEIQANEGVGAVLNNPTVTFEMLDLDNNPPYFRTITQAIVTIAPVPQWRIIDAGDGRNVGYMEFATFISTADPVFDAVFSAFAVANVSEVIIDLRYNGGGLVRTAELLGDYLGGFVAENLIFSKTEFNADRAAVNNSTEFFERLGNSINLSQLVIVATQGTASASELVTNSMMPHVDVSIVGDRTFGKPVGQIGLTFCDKILRPTSFQTVNANDEGDYFDGLPVDCTAPDDLSILVGEDADPNMIAAMELLSTGACPVAAVPGGQFKVSSERAVRQRDRRGPPEREFADAY
ncbi:MAG: hypothetical protein IH910_01100 [Proteobacteria bacterium]|nr:hypothetical protein [Pseudomonadota bacterium]